jgi:hypothetical protein
MRVIVMFMILLCTVSCENQADVIDDIARLRKERDVISSEYNAERKKRDVVASEVESLEDKLKELRIYESGRTPKYLVRFELSHDYFSTEETIDDIVFDMHVDRDFYRSVSVGTKLNNSLIGSYSLWSDYGDWDMKVIGKHIN